MPERFLICPAARAVAATSGVDAVLIVTVPQVGPTTDRYEHRVDDGALTAVVCPADPCAQLERRFELAWIHAELLHGPPETLRAGVHQAVQHLVPGGQVGAGPGELTELLGLIAEFRLDPVATVEELALFRRPTRTTVHDLLFEARSQIKRISPATLSELLRGADAPVVIDTRTHADRARSGVIKDSIHVPRTVLEWHLDPVNGYRHPAIQSFDQAIVVVCNGGYSSSLAAANLGRIGFTNACDLIGGMHAWRAADLPTHPPDHSHLDL